MNVENWRQLPEDVQRELTWFHQHALDAKLTWPACVEALDYDRSTIFRVLRGSYAGNWANVVAKIKSYRKLVEQRGRIQQTEFAENSITRTIFAALDYARANGSITVIETESRFGKTTTAKEWARRNNHGQSVFVTAPVIGGIAALIRAIAEKVGVNRSAGCNQIAEGLHRAFNKNRILIVDEAHRLLPGGRRNDNPIKLEFLRDLRDQTGCALALLVTKRFNVALTSGAYQYEQLVGRIGMPVKIKPTIKRDDILPIVRQFIKSPTSALVDELHAIANKPGRLGMMVETLKAASQMANVDKTALGELHVRKAIALRHYMSGGEEGAR